MCAVPSWHTVYFTNNFDKKERGGSRYLNLTFMANVCLIRLGLHLRQRGLINTYWVLWHIDLGFTFLKM